MLKKLTCFVFIWFKLRLLSSSATSSPSLPSNGAYFDNERYIKDIVSGENIWTSTVNVASLGRLANLGDFYDIRRQSFSGISLFKTDSFKDATYSVDNPYAKFDYTKTETVKEKTKILRFGAKVAVDVLLGIIPAYKGSGGYLKENKKKFDNAKLSLIYTLRTKTEILKIFTKSSKLSMDLNSLYATDSTHIVVGIDWGADIVMSVEEASVESETSQNISGDLGSVLKKSGEAIANAIGNLLINLGKLGKSTWFTIEFHGDVTPNVLPQNLNDSIEFMRNVPDLIAKENDGKGKKMNYILMPINTVRKVMMTETSRKTNDDIPEINDSFFEEAIDLYQEMEDSELLIKDVYSEVENWQHFASDDFPRISAYKSDFESAFSYMKQNISNCIQNIYKGNLDSRSLHDSISEYSNSSWSANNVMTTLSTYNKTMKKIKTMKLLKSGHFITNNLENILFENYNREIRVISVDLDALDVSTEIFDRIMKLLESKNKEGILYYIWNIEGKELIVTSYKYGNAIKSTYLSINKQEYLLVKDKNGFVTIIHAKNYDLVNSYKLEELENSTLAVVANKTFFKIDVLVGKIFSTKIENILSNTVNITWNLVGSFPAESEFIQANTIEKNSEIFFITKSGILYKFDSKLKATFVLGNTTATGNYASIVKYKNYLYIHKDRGFYEFNGTDVKKISTDSGEKIDCGLVVIKDEICRIGGNLENFSSSSRFSSNSVTCYEPASALWTEKKWILKDEQDRPGIAYTSRGFVIIGGRSFISEKKSEKYWQPTMKILNIDSGSFEYISSDFPNGLTAPLAVTFYY